MHKREKKDYSAKFDFLGFSFQPRTIMLKNRRLVLMCSPGISQSSKTRIVEKINKLNLHNRTGQTIEDLARELNPKLRGWINYYAKYGRKEFTRVLLILEYRLCKWVLNKYKNMGGKRRGFEWLKRSRKTNPSLFAHWAAGFHI